MPIKNKLKDLRHDFRMDQTEFASFLGVNNNLYNRWENNKVQPSLEWAIKISMKTKRPIESFIYLDPES
jgi:putative transcriptional regulator